MEAWTGEQLDADNPERDCVEAARRRWKPRQRAKTWYVLPSHEVWRQLGTDGKPGLRPILQARPVEAARRRGKPRQRQIQAPSARRSVVEAARRRWKPRRTLYIGCAIGKCGGSSAPMEAGTCMTTRRASRSSCVEAARRRRKPRRLRIRRSEASEEV